MQSPKMHPFPPGPKARLGSATVSRTAAAGLATRILIVDQDRQVGVALSFMLSARRFDDVRAVRSANRAVAITEQFRPEIVFLDVELPDDGVIAVARKLARDACKPRPRLIALTPDADHPMHEKTRSAGFERFLVKPVSHEELDEILGISRKA
jgi:two-component system, chemotaxis family, CheB/CheR fusion protein